ncbi:metal ABC transporter permease [Sporolactobacillus pectinivorans]|uniref:metal ABC transporter permease n=1 Tax=Sporolactobacillus pectinivorans TaxID=1591408 RepID=UPI000C262AE9|nr:metal ABC transporter permease [Sporolactobacillus pectinivorans]
MNRLMGFVFAPGFFENAQVLNALWMGGIVAVLSGVMGVFVVLRGQSFAGHAISDFGGAGAAITFLFGVNTLWGFLIFGLLSAMGVEAIGNQAKERDIATGIVLSVALGLESLFLFLDTSFTGQASAPMMILFGSVFLINTATMPVLAVLTLAAAVTLSIIFRPLLFSSIDSELAMTHSIPVRLIRFIFIILMALVVEESSLVIGALLSTALLIGPAATAMRLTKKIGYAMLCAAILGMFSMWAGIVLAYDSFHWPPFGRGWPVSFFVCILILVSYLLTRLPHGHIFKPSKGEVAHA